MKVPTGSLLFFHLDLPGIFGFLIMGQRTFVAGVGGRNFQMSKAFLRLTGSGHGGVRMARTLGRKMEVTVTFPRGQCHPSMKGLVQQVRNILFFNPHPRICLLVLEREEGGERDID